MSILTTGKHVFKYIYMSHICFFIDQLQHQLVHLYPTLKLRTHSNIQWMHASIIACHDSTIYFLLKRLDPSQLCFFG